MAVATSTDFREVLLKSGLITADEIDRFAAQESCSTDQPATLVAALVEAKLLTPWQRDKLLEGRHKGFFLGKYRILSQLGAGNMGAVFLAEHKLMRHKVAIKVLARRLVGKDKHLMRFEQEARAAAVVNHPRVVRAYDFDCDGDVHYLVMEYAEGEDLQKIVLRDGVLPIPVAAECIRQTAEGLAAAHEAGLIHRDIKPGNLLIDSAGNVRILDLGLARLDDPAAPSLTLMHDAKMIGTVDFLAPEQARNSHAIDGRADLYSLGCTLYFLLCGEPPFNDGTIAQRVIEHQTKLPVDIRLKRPDCPAGLAVICHKLLAKQPDQRYSSAQEVVAAVQGFLDRYEGRLPGSGSSPSYRLPPANGSKAQHVGDELSILTETQAVAASETSTSGLDDELGLADDDDAVATAPSPPADSRPSPSAIASPAAANSAPADESSALQPAGAAKAEPAEALLPLAGSDSLAALLEQKMSDPLGARSVSVLSTTPLAAGASPAMEAYRRALAERDNQRPRSAWGAIKASVIVEEGPGGISYALWFLIASGIVLGLIICLIIYSYSQSAAPPKTIKDRRTEAVSR